MPKQKFVGEYQINASRSSCYSAPLLLPLIFHCVAHCDTVTGRIMMPALLVSNYENRTRHYEQRRMRPPEQLDQKSRFQQIID